MRMKTHARMTLAGLACVSALICTLVAAQPPTAGSLVIIDSAGKEQKVKEWTFTQGTRRLSWLAHPGAKEEPAKEDKDADTELTLTLLRTITHEGKTLTLEGLLGRVTAGYKLFPLHTFAEIQFGE